MNLETGEDEELTVKVEALLPEEEAEEEELEAGESTEAAAGY